MKNEETTVMACLELLDALTQSRISELRAMGLFFSFVAVGLLVMIWPLVHILHHFAAH